MRLRSAPIARAFALPLALALVVAPGMRDRLGATAPGAESYKLPISPPRDQGASDLCWVFATLSLLETNYRVRHPGTHVEFSRGAMQREAMIDRLGRFAPGEPRQLIEGGLAVEAIALIRSQGLVASEDFHEFVDAKPSFASASAQPEPALEPTPALTHLDETALTPQAMAQAALGERTWSEYDVAADGAERIGPSPDPDARPETRVHFAPKSRLIALIHASLKRGEAVVGGTPDHALLIFGADYDAQGEPLAYWLKDSEPPYVYRMLAAEFHEMLNDVTVADARE